MADGRRTRWVAHDVYFLDDGLGATMFDRFGATGIALWHGFVAACKKNHVEGEVSFASDAEALTIFGLPGMPLVDLDGHEFELSDWLDLMSAHKVIRRSRRGRRIKVACTKWDRWQSSARRYRKAEQQAADRADAEADQDDDRSDAGPSEDDNTDDEGEHQPGDSQEEGQQNRRSDGDFIGTESAQNGHDAFQLEAQMTDTDTDTEKFKVKTIAADAADAEPEPDDDPFPTRPKPGVTLTDQVAGWAKRNTGERRVESSYDRVVWALDVADHAIGGSDLHRGVCSSLVVEWLRLAWGDDVDLPDETVSTIRRQCNTEGPRRALAACREASDHGAAIGEQYADDPRAFAKYTAKILSGWRRGAA